MLEENVQALSEDVRNLVADAQELLQTAAEASGEKAVELREQAVDLLDAAIGKVQGAQGKAIDVGKHIVYTTEQQIKQYPWRALAAGVGVGLVCGALLTRGEKNSAAS